jgi:DNA-binding MarR family transcriptional regulator
VPHDFTVHHPNPIDDPTMAMKKKKKKKKTSPYKRSPPPLNVAVLRSFRVIYGSVRHHFREVQRTCGISGSQIWILHELIKASGIGVSELADKLSIHQSTCSQLIEKLVRAGHVSKTWHKDDGRRAVLTVSAKGRRTLSRVPGPAEGVLPEAIAELTKAELRSLHRSLERLIESLDVKDDAAGDKPLADL